jgi:2-polyprenyl-3-methyl-5-hydroxy-6-metoxy-1,4-benzoquinol methylase
VKKSRIHAKKSEEVQNIYDNATFFESYKKLRINDLGFNSLIEQPALRALLSNLDGKIIMDIGCGFGDFCRYAATQGASKIKGIDPSEKMLEEAKKYTTEKNIQYECAPIEFYTTGENEFDVIVSSLAFHYVKDFPAIINKIYSWLKPGGVLVFSVEHPICTANPNVRSGTDDEGTFHPIYNYRDEKQFKQKWFVDNVIKYHRTLATYLNTLIENGLQVTKVVEPMPDDILIKARPEFAIHKIRPPLLMIASQKP